MTKDQEGKDAVRRKSGARPLGGRTGPKVAAGRRMQSSQAGHAMEPPPVIKPAAQPQRATGAVKTIGGDAARSGITFTAASPPTGRAKPRSYRTSKSVDPAAVERSLAPPPASDKTAVRGGPAAAGGAATATAIATAPGPPAGAPVGAPPGAPPGAPVGAEPAAAKIKAAGVTATGLTAGSKSVKGVRRIKLQLRYISPLSVAKISFFISLAAGVALVVMVWVLWHALDDKTVFTEINNMIVDLAGAPKAKELDLLSYVELGRVMSGTMMIAAIDVVIWTLLATLGTVIYNLLSALIGGVHVTLQEK